MPPAGVAKQKPQPALGVWPGLSFPLPQATPKEQGRNLYKVKKWSRQHIKEMLFTTTISRCQKAVGGQLRAQT